MPVSADKESESANSGYTQEISTYSDIDYNTYLQGKSDASITEPITVSALDYLSYNGLTPDIVQLDGIDCVKTDASGTLSWKMNVQKTGLYDVLFNYYPLEGYGDTIERAFYIDGKLPYNEAHNLQFSRRFSDKGEKKYSSTGNEYRREQIEIFEWFSAGAYSGSGYETESLKVYLTAGAHELSLVGVAEPAAFGDTVFYLEEKLPTYSEVLSAYKEKGYREVSDLNCIEGENTSCKSSAMLYALEDRTTPANSPYDPAKIQLNMIGGNNWKYKGQWIEWEFDAQESGLYTLTFRTKQDYVSGASAFRKLYINGSVPFAEVNAIRVPYSLRWQMMSLGDEDGAYLFYFEKGKNTIRLEVTTGPMGEVLNGISEISERLTSLYRKISVITGSFPDPLRDYHLEDSITDMYDTIRSAIDGLKNAETQLKAISGNKGEQTVSIDKMVVLLQKFLSDKDSIPEQVATFGDYINNLSSWVASATEVPLLIDYFVIASSSDELPKADVGFLTKTFNSIREFICSFTVDYYTVESFADESKVHSEITLWLDSSSGRDQATILRDLIDRYFVADTGIDVNVRLVSMSVLMQAVAGGTGPDVALFQGQASPMNYGVRQALIDLSTFDDCDEICSRFDNSALVPFRLGNSLYALPEQQVFMMMFVRDDILSELGLSAPNTWDELYALIPSLQEQGMEIGLPCPTTVQSGSDATALNPMLATLLMQNNTSVYDADNRLCSLNSLSAVDCFVEWAEFYTKYNFTKSYSNINRFRTGTMPIVLCEYTFYNSLVLAAPEISGKWSIKPIPATVNSDGSLCRSVSSSSSSCMIFKNASDVNASWEFLKWWTSEDTQVRYGKELESIQGASARWPTANKNAFERMGWSNSAVKALKEQWKSVCGIPEVPGGYYVGRTVSNAIKSVVNMGENPRETLLDAVEDINREIINKRQEFGLE